MSFKAGLPQTAMKPTALVCEIAMTYMFLIVILGATHGRAPVGFAGIAIGLALTLIHLISIPVTNTSVNPARSTGPAIFVGGWAIAQLWLSSGWRQSWVPSSPVGLTFGSVRKIRQGEFRSRAIGHGDKRLAKTAMTDLFIEEKNYDSDGQGGVDRRQEFAVTWRVATL
jgi:major intrinsic protein